MARQGKATQSSTSNGGDASRAIDGNKSGKYGDGGQTHTKENETNPWWEVDLGKEVNVNTIHVYNRTDANLGKRLDGFTLKVLNQNRKVVFERKKQSAPAVKATFELIGAAEPEVVVRRGRDAGVDCGARQGERRRSRRWLHSCSKDGDPLRRHPRPAAHPGQCWPKEEATRPLLEDVLAYIVQACRSTSGPPRKCLDALQLADNLASLLPLDEAKAGPQGTGRVGCARHPHGHRAGPDALRQGSHRRQGRQASRDHFRQHRPDAAQFGGDRSRSTGGGRQPRRGHGDATGSARAALRAGQQESAVRHQAARLPAKCRS